MNDSVCNDLRKVVGEMNELMEDIKKCKMCAQADGFPNVGAGYPSADIVFITGNPVPEASAVEALYLITSALGWNPAFIYSTSAVKCRVNRGLEQDSCVQQCSRWLKREIYIARPKRLIAFGEVARKSLQAAIGHDDGEVWKTGNIKQWTPDTKVVITEDLEYALKNKDAKHEVWRHLQSIKNDPEF